MSKIDNFRGEYRFLSNFYASPFKWRGQIWPSVEHAYQAAKTDCTTTQQYIRDAATPGQAKARGRKVEMIKDWDEKKVEVMRDLLKRKFAQNKDQRLMLEATGDAELVEGNTWGDTFWGVCRGEGQNMLGKLLMEIRDGKSG